MFYVTGMFKDVGRGLVYVYIFDTNTDSTVKYATAEIIEMLRQNIKIANLTVEHNKFLFSNWLEAAFTHEDEEDSEDEYKCIAVCKYDDNHFKVVTTDNIVFEQSRNNIISMTNQGIMLNCIYNRNNNQFYAYDVTEVHNDAQFVNSIKKKYEHYIGKSALLGMDNSFIYTIENNRVILTRYEGSCKDLVLPNFIHFINKSAFTNCNLNSIQLNDGLLGIGNYAFLFNKINQLNIPKSVRFIGTRIVDDNTTLIR